MTDIDSAIAVIGLDLKGPGEATNPEAFFNMLLEGRSALSEVPKNRFNVEAFYHPDQERAGMMNVSKAHFLAEDIAAFDAPFFSISPNEATCIDPQHRQLLEAVYRALENAGIPMSEVAGGNTGVYVGSSTRDYDQVVMKDPEADIKYSATGLSPAMLSNRISWFYDLRGPSLSMDTACSSSLNACHLACNSLKLMESSMAIVCGSNIYLTPETCIPMTNLGFLSPDGKCQSFDGKANGYSRGEGFGVVILKRLSDAIKDGNTIRAVIRGTATGADGKTPGITQPRKDAQLAAIHQAYAQAGLDLTSTRFFEAHGTGTQIGDSTEASAIASAFSRYRSHASPLYVGALKTNIGHLEGAAGIVSLIKIILSLEQGIIPPNLWFNTVNPNIPEKAWNLNFPTLPIPWPKGLRRASLNAMGFGGSNCHVIVDDAMHYLSERKLIANHQTLVDSEFSLHSQREHVNGITSRDSNSLCDKTDMSASLSDIQNGVITPPGSDGGADGDIPRKDQNISKVKLPLPKVFVFSAFDEGGIERLRELYLAHLAPRSDTIKDHDTYLDDLCNTLACHRTAFTWRSFAIASSMSSLVGQLNSPLTTIRSNPDARAAFVFTGQGAQWHAMGRELLIYPVFKESLDKASTYLRSLGCPWVLLDELQKSESASSIDDPTYSQPICTALQIALVELLTSWDIFPSAVVGHSSGEIAAAFSFGAISRETAWRLAYIRGLLSSVLANNSLLEPVGMMAVALTPLELKSNIDKLGPNHASNISVACYNSPKNITLSGTCKSLDGLKATLDEAGIFCRKLKVENAYHSNHMAPIATFYHRLIGSIEPGIRKKENNSKFFSSLTGQQEEAEFLVSPQYWIDNLVSPVRFSEAVTKLLSSSKSRVPRLGSKQSFDPISDLVEIGPHAALRGPIREILDTIPDTDHVAYESVLKRGVPATESLLYVVGWLFCRGHRLRLESIGQTGNEPRPPKLLTKLPSYPFNHTKTYWSESRLSKSYRFRRFPRHELLGAPVPDWDEKNAIWRNWIRISENPWILDHKVTGSILYPAAGFLVMAIEACRQLAVTGKTIKAFKLKEISFHRALQIPQNAEGVETHFYLKPHTLHPTSSWKEFELHSFASDTWTEHCRGLISTEYETMYTSVDEGLEDREFTEVCKTAVESAERSCQLGVSSKQLYKLLEEMGFQFGETFRTLSDVKVDQDRNCIATISASDIRSKMTHAYIQPHLIHPSTLDGILQSVVAAMTRGGRDIRDAMVPTSIKELWVAAGPSVEHGLHRLQAQSKSLGPREEQASIISIDPTTHRPLVVVKDFVMTAVSQREEPQTEDMARHLCFNIDWKPDPYFVTDQNANQAFESPNSIEAFDQREQYVELETLCILYLKRYMASNPIPKIASMKPHHQKFVAWIQHQLERYERGELPLPRPNCYRLAEDDAYFHELETRVESHSVQGALTVAFGQSIPDVLEGKADPLQVMFRDGKADNVYRSDTGADIYGKMCRYIGALAHKDPTLKILEVGAGTGGATHWVMKSLMQHGEAEEGAPRFESYDFTDLSPSFFEKAKKTFDYALEYMNFKVLDIEKSPEQQGFDLGYYDVVIAANSLHATTSMDRTLANVRKLLKPQGKLVLYETTNLDVSFHRFFGLLPGWWLSVEPHRQWGPLMDVPTWTSHLIRTGFSGLDICFRDFEGDIGQTSVLISTATGSDEKVPTSPNVLLIPSSSPEQLEFSSQLKGSLAEVGVSDCEIRNIDELANFDFAKKICIFLPELESSFLSGLNHSNHKLLQRMSSFAKGILWLTHGGGISPSNPLVEMVTGFARTIRLENPTLTFVTLNFEGNPSRESQISTIMKIFDPAFIYGDSRVVDNTFSVVDDVIYIPRILEANYMNNAISTRTQHFMPEVVSLGDNSDRALHLVHGAAGILDNLHLAEDPNYDNPLQENEIEMRTMASGVNFRDILVLLGHIKLHQVGIGIEAAGIITRTGPNTKLKPGDRVCGMVSGGMNTFARAQENTITKIPEKMNFVSAASLTIVFITAYCALYEIADIQKGETVLIHAAAGGVGQACIQLAQARGAEIFATVGSKEKRELLQTRFRIPRDHILSSRDLTFAQGIDRLTGSRGVDVVVNSLSGEALRASWDCIAPCGRFVEIGKVDIYSSAKLNMEKFKYNVRFQCLDVAFMGECEPMRFKKVLEAVMHLYAKGTIKDLYPVQVFSFSQLHDAFHLMQSGKHSGKIVLEPRADDQVPVIPRRNYNYSFDSKGTYLISGGLGGIGQSIARRLVKRGARNLILLSRSGTASKDAKQLLADLTACGAHVAAPACDVSDRNALRAVLDECMKTMPPIKGCVQGAMVLRDSMYADMSLDDYHAALRPKVEASWNLHELLPKDMDFFIMLSSGTGIIGRGGLSNYAIGNTYQDALARYRVSNGMKATSLDLGIILSVGYVSLTVNDFQRLREVGYAVLREDELHAMLDDLCDPSLPVASAFKSQICLGFELPETMRAKGIDYPWWIQDPLFRHTFRIHTTTGKVEQGNESLNYKAMFIAAETREAGEAVIVEATIQRLAKALSMKVEEIHPSQPLHAYGVDSLVAVELRTWFLKELGAEIAVFDIMGDRNIKALASLAAGRSTLVKFSDPQD